MQEQVQAKGRVNIVLRDEAGNIKEEHNIDNLVVSVGKNHITSRLLGYAGSAGSTVNTMSHMAVGTTNTAAAAGNTTLGAEVASSRVALTSSTLTTISTSNDSIIYVGTYPAGTGTGSLVEAGIFNAASAGIMLCRTVFSTVTKGAGDSMVITWTVTIS